MLTLSLALVVNSSSSSMLARSSASYLQTDTIRWSAYSPPLPPRPTVQLLPVNQSSRQIGSQSVEAPGGGLRSPGTSSKHPVNTPYLTTLHLQISPSCRCRVLFYVKHAIMFRYKQNKNKTFKIFSLNTQVFLIFCIPNIKV